MNDNKHSDSIDNLKMTPEEYEQQKNNYTFIDVRKPLETKILRKIDGAINLPLKKIPNSYKTELPDKNAKIITSCNTTIRGKKAAEFLYEHGYKNVKYLENGIYGLHEKAETEKEKAKEDDMLDKHSQKETITKNLNLPLHIDNKAYHSIRFNVLTIDVRTELENQTLRQFKWAKNIPIALLEKEFETKLPENKYTRIVTVCNSGNRSTTAAEFLRHKGYTNVQVLTTGIYGYYRKYR